MTKTLIGRIYWTSHLKAPDEATIEWVPDVDPVTMADACNDVLQQASKTQAQKARELQDPLNNRCQECGYKQSTCTCEEAI